MTHNPSSNLVSSLFNTKKTLSSLMTQSNNLAKLTGEACLIGEKLKKALFVCNSEIIVNAFNQIVKGINPHVITEQFSLTDFNPSELTSKDSTNSYDIVIIILSDSADINKVTDLDLSHTLSSKVFVIAPQSFQLPALNKLGASVTLALESSAEDIRNAFLRGIQGEQFDQGFTESFNEKYAALTPRQRQVLKLMAEGKSNKEIARELDNEVSTIKVHCSAIFKFLGVTTRNQVIAIV